MGSPTGDRNLACKLAETDHAAAFAVANRITDSWFKTQALAAVARFAPAKEFHRVIDLARAASLEAADPYRIVVPACWYVRALQERGHRELAVQELAALRARANKIEHPVSRIEAVSHLFYTAADFDDMRPLILADLVKACSVAKSWRSGSRLLWAVSWLVAKGRHGDAVSVMQTMRESRYKRRAAEAIARCED